MQKGMVSQNPTVGKIHGIVLYNDDNLLQNPNENSFNLII